MKTILYVIGAEKYEHDQVLGFFPDTAEGLEAALKIEVELHKDLCVYRVPMGVEVNQFGNDFELVAKK